MSLRSLCVSLSLFLLVIGGSQVLGLNQAWGDARVVITQPRSDRQIELNLHGSAYYGYGWYDNLYGYSRWGDYAVGPGLQMLFPIVKNAIPSLNNPMYLGFFADFLLLPHSRDGFDRFIFGPSFGLVFQWRFVILDLFQSGSLSAFANLGFGLWPWITRGYYCDCVPFYGFPLFELGANLFFTRNIGLTWSLGYPAVKFGVTFAF